MLLPPMGGIVTVLTRLAILGVVCLSWAVLGALTYRYSLFYLGVLAVVVLPIAYWKQARFGPNCILFIVLAVAFAASPVDVAVRSDGQVRVRVLPVSYGRACKVDTACYGCDTPVHPARRAVVITY